MAKHFSKTLQIDAPPDKLMEVLIAPDFQVAREKAQGVLEVKVQELSHSDSMLVYEVHNTEYAKGVGGVDKNKTEQVVYTYTWDLEQKRCSWTYRSQHGNRVRVEGTLEIRPSGDGSRLRDEFTVEVKIPLVGGKIEGIVLKEVEKGFPAYEKVLKEHAES